MRVTFFAMGCTDAIVYVCMKSKVFAKGQTEAKRASRVHRKYAKSQ